MTFKITDRRGLNKGPASDQLIAGGTFEAVIIAAAADLEGSAENRYRKQLAMVFDPGVLYSNSLAKYAAAFFKMSFSILSRAFS
jgi:hypothetical protein